ncbi:MAG: hypothetical protein JRH06_00555 [Deltaproteobacteria bacterium]|nr:hypothetical protein [Deltaproteobacteria bacterium]MBW2136031.1 hypothetical protein [Deltaproteobacteria bacterium]
MKESSRKKVGEPRDQEALLKDILTLPGSLLVERVLRHGNPFELIQKMSHEDFFWLVKRVGDEDSLPLLAVASEEQWQFLLDLEIWEGDRIDLSKGLYWLKQLHVASPERLARWILDEGWGLAGCLLYKNLQVVAVQNKEDAFDLNNDFLSLDGILYIKVLNREHREFLWEVLRVMAEEDLAGYQGFIQGIAGFQADEVEEETYRFRNARLQEYGFLPREEALSIYSPLDPEKIRVNNKRDLPGPPHDERETLGLAPLLPFNHVGGSNLMKKSLETPADPLFLDRVRMEFAGLCNQILSAEGLHVEELDDLIGACRRASSYVNLGLERLCGNDISSARGTLRAHPLSSLFRVGFGLALKLKGETERWIGTSWFYRQGLDFTFWGESWGGTLAGITKRRPLLYEGKGAAQEFRDFERLSDLGGLLEVLRRVMVLDGLLDQLTKSIPMDEVLVEEPELTFLPLLFNLWCRRLLSLEPGFSGITSDQARRAFERLRRGEEGPPFKMVGFREVFIKDFVDYASDADPEAQGILADTLSIIWHEFAEEHCMVVTGEIDGKYSRFITVEPSR